MIEITKLQIGPYERPVPPGLSELLADCWVPKSQIKPCKGLDDYEVTHEMIDGKVVSTYTYKGGRK